MFIFLKIKQNKLINSWSIIIVITINFFFTTGIYAAHPLITEDTGTQGKGKMQIELNGEHNRDKEDGVTEKNTQIAGIFTYGLTDNLDIITGIPYLFACTRSEGDTTKEKGISDASFGVKWRFYEEKKFSFALKPEVSLPAGDHEKGLGSGKPGYSGFFVTTFNFELFSFHFHTGYIRNENKLEEEKNLWHISAACEYRLWENLRIIADAGINKNTDPDADENPAFILGGIIYSVRENIDLDAGLKYGLNKPETDYSILAGIAIRI
ncbi:MAG: transporter [Spirochaetota bacterium]